MNPFRIVLIGLFSTVCIVACKPGHKGNKKLDLGKADPAQVETTTSTIEHQIIFDVEDSETALMVANQIFKANSFDRDDLKLGDCYAWGIVSKNYFWKIRHINLKDEVSDKGKEFWSAFQDISTTEDKETKNAIVALARAEICPFSGHANFTIENFRENLKLYIKYLKNLKLAVQYGYAEMNDPYFSTTKDARDFFDTVHLYHTTAVEHESMFSMNQITMNPQDHFDDYRTGNYLGKLANNFTWIENSYNEFDKSSESYREYAETINELYLASKAIVMHPKLTDADLVWINNKAKQNAELARQLTKEFDEVQ